MSLLRRGLCFQRERRRIQRVLLLPVAALLILIFGTTTIVTWIVTQDINSVESTRRVSRAASFEDCFRPKTVPSDPSSSDSDQFPPDLFSLQQRQSGAVLFHLAGLVYMFVALAVVCDEFFVPSLGVLIDKLSISEDVAGATFMAAGGSAPEFFTSVFGVFVAQNNVGIGTIVGSATFNILCVLAFCTLFSREVLQLTWWPLFRDMFFYIVALLFLVIFFSDERISWHEALSMFLLYVIYGLFMKYNTELETKAKTWLKMDNTPQTQSSSQPGMVETHCREHRRSVWSIPMIHGGMREGLAQMAIGSDEESDHDHAPPSHRQKIIRVRPAGDRLFVNANSGIPSVSGSVDDERRKRNQIAPVEVVHRTDYTLNHNNNNNNNTNNNNKNNNHTNNSTHRSNKPSHRGSVELISSRTAVIATNGNAIHIPPLAIDTLSQDSVSSERPLDLSWPDTMLKRFIFICLAPITFPLALTLPDVRKQSKRRWFLVTFVGSILWIALYSYLMVWWANTIGETFAIPTEIMGLTILAAGTSIPDLITSVIVARKGLGDMAVSSSIGSNLFDICIGLPIPWLMYFMVALFKNSPGPFPTVSVVSNGLICSVGLLFFMLVVLVICIALSQWKMDKKFGLAMIFSYIIFCIFSIFLETGTINCPLRISEAC